jgi:hypothetical protein
MGGGHVGINVNDQVGKNFQTHRVRQGDPLSLILFNIVVDVLAILINRARHGGQILGVISNINDDRLSILQYADGMILFVDHNLEPAKNMKLLLAAFEQLSGLKINYHKIELFCFGDAKDHETQYELLFGCKKGSYPFRYLEIPRHYRKLYNSDWRMIEERIEKNWVVGKGNTYPWMVV